MSTPTLVTALERKVRRSLGVRAIIAYKLLKAPVVVGIAIWLTFFPSAALYAEERLVHQLSEGAAIWVRLGAWLEANFSIKVVTRTAILAWFDGAITVLEAVLLMMGKVWGEWLVTVGLAVLIPFELISLQHRPGVVKAVVLAINTLVVVYLVWRRLQPSELAPGDGARQRAE